MGSQAVLQQPWSLDFLGKWSYFGIVCLYILLTTVLLFYFRKTFIFHKRKFFFTITSLSLLVLGLGLEFLSDVFETWTFYLDRFLFPIPVPIFGWITGHQVPFSESLWIMISIPMFYFLFQYFTLMFHDIIFVMTPEGKFYKKEDRWVGLGKVTHVGLRHRGKRGRENETYVIVRQPSSLEKWLAKIFNT